MGASAREAREVRHDSGADSARTGPHGSQISRHPRAVPPALGMRRKTGRPARPAFDTPPLGQLRRARGFPTGVTAIRQLSRARAGPGPPRIARWRRSTRGVYAVGHRAPSRHGRWMAAVLACGQGAALSHLGRRAVGIAAEQRGADRRHRARHQRPRGRALRIHRVATLRADEATAKDGDPRHDPRAHDPRPRRHPPSAHLENVLDRMEFLELTDYPALAALARAHPGHRGAQQAPGHPRHATTPATNLTRSDLEILFRQLCHDHGLPQPRVNTTVARQGGRLPLRTAHRLIVEADSWRYHRTRRAFEDDRARDVLTTKAGYRTLRFTDRRLTDDPTVAAAIRATALLYPLPRRESRQDAPHRSAPRRHPRGRRAHLRRRGGHRERPGSRHARRSPPACACPWGIAFLPDGSALVSERDTGRILRIAPTAAQARSSCACPGVDTNAGEGGLLGLAVSPTLRAGPARLRLLHDRPRQPHRPLPARRPPRSAIVTGTAAAIIHNGGRIAFGPTASSTPASARPATRPRPEPQRPERQDPADEPERRACRPATRSGLARLVAAATATSRASPGTRRAACGRPSSARTASTRST